MHPGRGTEIEGLQEIRDEGVQRIRCQCGLGDERVREMMGCRMQMVKGSEAEDCVGMRKGVCSHDGVHWIAQR